MLFGRETELERIRGALADPRTAVIVGEAGVGKTALARAAATEAGELREGGGLRSLTWMAYAPLTRALGEPLPGGDAAGIAAFVAERVGGGVLFIDDLHWADPETLGLIDHLSGRVALCLAVRSGDPGAAGALAAVAELEHERFDVGPLDPAAADDLLDTLAPELEPARAAMVLARADGNPLLLEELARAGDDSPSLRLILAARAAGLSEAARDAATKLALLGRPADASLVGDALSELSGAGLVRSHDGLVEIRHALIADALVEDAHPDTLQAHHALLARAVSDPGEAAHHHFAAGELALAHRRAVRAVAAATVPGERARHLKLAAATAQGPDATALSIEALAALNKAGDYAGALDLADGIDPRDPADAAAIALERCTALAYLGRWHEAEQRVDEGIGLAEGVGDEALLTRLHLERARILFSRDWASEEALAEAELALELSERTGVQRAEALRLLAGSYYVRTMPESADLFERALEAARAEGDPSNELRTAVQYVNALQLSGRVDEAELRVGEFAAQAERQHLFNRRAEFRFMAATFAIDARGELERGVAEIAELLAEPTLLGEYLPDAEARHALALADLGRHAEAAASLDRWETTALTEVHRQFALATRAETQWLAGALEEALAGVQAALAVDTDSPNVAFMEALRAWTELELGLPISRAQAPERPFTALALQEEGLVLLSRGEDLERAEELFAEATDAWLEFEFREALRCRWAAGLAALRRDERERAVERLLAAEQLAEARGMQPMLARIRRALRQAGLTRSTSRARERDGIVSAREREVLELVGQGLSSRAIARRLGLAPSTVDSHIRSAMRKLDARTRREAVALAAGSLER